MLIWNASERVVFVGLHHRTGLRLALHFIICTGHTACDSIALGMTTTQWNGRAKIALEHVGDIK